MRGLRQIKLGLVGTPSQLGLIPGLSAYTVGVSKASDGTNELNSKVPALTSGVGQLATGSKALYAWYNTTKRSSATIDKRCWSISNRFKSLVCLVQRN
ncbi:hypothetical protein QY890_06470 [Latilactobacillus sakei]